MLSLKYFGVVSRERSLNRAAQILNASQPAVSRRIQQLEHQVGARLFQRQFTGVVQTPAGRALARYADEINRLIDEALHAVRQVAGRPGKSVRIGYYQPALTVLVPLLRLLQARHPQIQVEPVEETRTSVLEALRKAQIDLALPGYVPPEILLDFDGLRVPSPVCNFVLPDGHRFARRKSLRFAQLKNEEFVSLDEEEFPGVTILLLQQCRRAGFKPRISVYARNWSEATAHVLAGRGIALAPPSAIALPLASAVILINAEIAPEWYALWNTNNGNPRLDTIIQLLRDDLPLG